VIALVKFRFFIRPLILLPIHPIKTNFTKAITVKNHMSVKYPTKKKKKPCEVKKISKKRKKKKILKKKKKKKKEKKSKKIMRIQISFFY